MTAPGHDHGASPASDGAAAGMRGGWWNSPPAAA